MNLNYGLEPNKAMSGTFSDNGFTDSVAVNAMEDIGFGRPVMREKGTKNGYAARKNLGVIVFGSALGASNVVNGAVNGVSIAAVTYATSEMATLAVIKAAIETAVPLAVVTVVLANHAINVKLNGAAVSMTGWAVTGGSAVTVTLTHTTDLVFAGIAHHHHNPKGKYVKNDSIPVTRVGRIIADVAVAVATDDQLYVDLVTGKLTNVSTGNVKTLAIVVDGGSTTASVQLVGGAETGFFNDGGEVVPPVTP